MVYRIAGAQIDITFADPDANLERMRRCVDEAVTNNAWLIVFPECTIAGYCFDSLDEARNLAEPLEGRSIKAVQRMCAAHGTRVIFGFLELAGERIFNSLALIDGGGTIATYRKVHLPHLGVDRFTTPGDRELDVIDVQGLRIGMNICYDCSFPETSRILMLKGADLIVLPTNWPPTSGLTADVIPPARALENNVYYLAVNRIGGERGFSFVGKSKFCDPRGNVLASADLCEETIIYGDVDPELARQKHLINIPGRHEIHRVNDRRPELYRSLI
jgi:predicted amidohydrolase